MKNNVSFNSELAKFGMGLFETIRVEEEPLDLDYHLDRMSNSIKELNITNYTKDFLKEAVLNYINENNIKNKALRLTIFDEGYNISIRDIVYNKSSYEKGFKLTKSPITRGNSILYKHKTTNYFENVYTKRYATANNFDDGLFVNEEGIVLECSMSNIFFIKGNKIYTPSSNLPLLNGIMKKKILEACEKLNIEVVEDNIKLQHIEDFEGAFVSNSLMKTMKVTQIDHVIFKNENPILDKIISCL